MYISMKIVEYDKLINVGDKNEKLVVIEPPRRQPKGKWKMWRVKIKCECGKEQDVCCARWIRREYSKCRNCQLIGPNNYAWNGYGEINGQTLCHIKHNAKIRGFRLEVTNKFLWELFLKQNRKCALSGLPIQFTLNKCEKTASLDRIDSSKGYTEDNIQWIHKDINLMKNNFDEIHFIKMCGLIYEYNKNRNTQ